MAPLVYVCLPCVLVWCSRGLRERDGIYLQLYTRSSGIGNGKPDLVILGQFLTHYQPLFQLN
jgi:hypothetical protein